MRNLIGGESYNICPFMTALLIITSPHPHYSICQDLPLPGWIIVHCLYTPHFVYLFISQTCKLLPHFGHWENAARNMGVEISIQVAAFTSFRVYTQKRNCWTRGKTILRFLRNCHTRFQGICTMLHSHHQGTGVPISLHPHNICYFGFWSCFLQ